MPAAPLPHDEAQRLYAVHELGIVDAPPQQELDDIVRMASSICGTPVAAVSILDAEHQWLKACVGMDFDETPRDQAFCGYTILKDEIMVVEDAEQDARFVDNPLVTGRPRIRFYAGAPLRLPGGAAVGALCVIDSVPGTLKPAARVALTSLRRQAETALALHLRERQLERANAELLTRQRQKETLVQFVVHDMRNALATIAANSEYLASAGPTPSEIEEIGVDLQNAGDTLLRLVANLMDISIAESPGRLHVKAEDVRLRELARAVRARLARRLQQSTLSVDVATGDVWVRADSGLLERVLDNLIDNALRTSPGGGIVGITWETTDDEVTVVVDDQGPGVPPDECERIFDLYHRGKELRGGWRGLGLPFCRLAVEAMSGRIWVEPSSPQGSRFCVTLPRTRTTD